MATTLALVDHFRAALAPGLCEQWSERSDLAAELDRLVSRAAAARATVVVAPETFVAYVATRIEAAPPLQLNTLPIEDLYLACGCALGDPQALAAFEAELMPDVERALGQLRLSAAVVDEAKQLLRERLFVAVPGSRRKIEEYAGRGKLRSWVRAVGLRTTLNLLRTLNAEVPFADGVLTALPVVTDDPELMYAKRLYGDALRKAMAEALAALESHERNLLRHVYIDRWDLDEVGRHLRVHRATVVRRLAAVRQKVIVKTRTILRTNLGLSPRELESILRLLDSQLSISLHGLEMQSGEGR